MGILNQSVMCKKILPEDKPDTLVNHHYILPSIFMDCKMMSCRMPEIPIVYFQNYETENGRKFAMTAAKT